MSIAIRFAQAALPLGLIFSGCAGPQHIESSSSPAPRRTARSAERSATLVADRSDDPMLNASAGLAATGSQHDITLEQIREHVRNGTAVVIDARSQELFARGHIRGAINVPAGDVGSYTPQVEQAAGRDQLLIIYCNGPSCGAGDAVYDHLRTQGFTNMRVYSPGWKTLAFAKNLQ